MRRLFVLRHAKSSWDDPALADHERPLTRRGARAAERIATLLSEHATPPRLALCSTARRALDTLAPIRAQLALRCAIEAGLYLASSEALLARLTRLDAAEASVLVIGHNPGLHEALLALVGSGKARLRSRLAERFPTAALAEVEIGVPAWSDLGPGCGRLVALTFARDLD